MSGTRTPVDVDSLPPTQYLILEVLAARHRMGEVTWTFPASLRPAVEALGKLGLVDELNGIAPKSTGARLTNTGRVAVLSDTYESPDVKRLRADLRVIAQYAEDCATSAVIERGDGFRSVADMARRAAGLPDQPTVTR